MHTKPQDLHQLCKLVMGRHYALHLLDYLQQKNITTSMGMPIDNSYISRVVKGERFNAQLYFIIEVYANNLYDTMLQTANEINA